MTSATTSDLQVPSPTPLTWARGAVFNLGMVLVALAFGLACLPLMMVERKWATLAVRLWCRCVLGLLRTLCGVKVEVRGLENLPDHGVLIAAKHQCMLDTMAPFNFLSAPSIVLKQELLSIPIYGWYAKQSGMIPIDRSGAAKTLRNLIRDVRQRYDEGHQIIIFPEGTRQLPGAEPDYKPGIAALYKELNIPCTPIATNSGLHWPAKGLARYPGTVVFEILPPIPAGLKRAEFMRQMQDQIETASNRLMREG